ncbi:hypothetical protein TNCV_4015741 [Trichonephila clavipes]|nr:hypothetical protein TNCV_4015741 [Trichonephila clavipes]
MASAWSWWSGDFPTSNCCKSGRAPLFSKIRRLDDCFLGVWTVTQSSIPYLDSFDVGLSESGVLHSALWHGVQFVPLFIPHLITQKSWS